MVWISGLGFRTCLGAPQSSQAAVPILVLDSLAQLASADTSAQALVLLDRTEITFDRGNNRTSERLQVIKILNVEGAARYQDGDTIRHRVPLDFDRQQEKCEVLTVRVREPDGKILSKSQVPSPKSQTPSLQASQVRFPALQPGAVVEYRVRVSPKRPGTQAQLSGIERLGGYDPILNQELVIVAPRGKDFRYAVAEPLDSAAAPVLKVESLGKTVRYTWFLRQERALPREPAEPKLDRRVFRVCFSSFPTWRELAEQVQRQFQRGLVLTPELKQQAGRLAKDKSQLDALRDIFRFVKQNVRNVELGRHGFEPGKPAQVLKQGYGDNRDQACLLLALMGAVGIEAHPLLVRRDRVEVVKETPTPEAFDHVLVMARINNNPVYLDPGSRFQPYGRLPESVQGAEALVLDAKNYRFVTLPTEEYDQNVALLTGELFAATDGQVTGTVKAKLTGCYDSHLRRRLNSEQTTQNPRSSAFISGSIPDSIAARFLTRLATSTPSGETLLSSNASLDSIVRSDLADPFKPVEFSFRFIPQSAQNQRGASGTVPRASAFISGSSPHSLVVPQPLFALDTIFALTRSEQRRTELSSLPWRILRYTCMIHLGPGASPSLPVTWFKENACVRALIRWEAKSGGIEFRSEFMLKKPELSPEEYKLVKAVADEFLKPELRTLRR